jgi:hypothetical protein
MTIIEAGVIAGGAAGATIGGVICKSQPVFSIASASVAGLVLGAVAGWLYAFVVIFLLSVVGVLWRAARKCADAVPTEADMKRMTPVAVFGTLFGVLIGLVYFLSTGWLFGLLAALAIAFVTSLVTVIRGEIR